MTTKKKLVPSIRFPEFKTEWERKKLNQFLSHSKAKNKNLKFDKSEVLSVAAEAGVVNQIEYHGRSYAGASVAPYGIVYKGELVYTKSPLKAYPYGIIKLNESKDGIVSTLYAIYKVKKSAHGKFLDYYFYHRPRINRYLKPLVNIGAKNDMKINNEYVISDFVTVPEYEEQYKITSFLSIIDSRIQQLTRKIELLEQYKKGIMQQIFSQKIRFKDENGKDFSDWEEKKLSEIGELITGLTYSPNDINIKGVLVLRSSNIRKRELSFKDNVYVITDSFNPVKENDILICVRNGSKRLIGKNALITKESEGLAFGAFMSVFRSKYNKYIFQVFATRLYKKNVHRNLGATINSINGSDLRKFKIPFPSISEQQKIISFFTAIDEKISSTRKQLDKMQTYKRGLLQQMFV